MEILILVILIFLSAFFSSAETAYTSLTNLQLSKLEKAKKFGFDIVKKLKKKEKRLLITILVGNNIVNIAASAIATKVAINSFGSAGVGVATGVMTFLILIFGEIFPKSYASANNIHLSCFFAYPIIFFQYLMFPVVFFFEIIITKALKIFKKDDSEFRKVTEDDVKQMLQKGIKDGEINDDEQKMIENIFEFDDMTVEEIMTPKPDIFYVHPEALVSEIIDSVVKSGFSRIPVYTKEEDQIIGIVYAKDILKYIKKNDLNILVKSIMREVLLIPQSKKIDDLLKEFKTKKIHIGAVLDEYGTFIGIVTLEDILEEIVGDIFDETDDKELEIIMLSDKEFIINGNTSIKDINYELKINIPESDKYDSIGGYIQFVLGRIPKKSDKINEEEFNIKILNMEKHRIKKINLIKKEKKLLEV